nr:uncharacterized protein LOC115255757 [Aedes albopictus]
MRSRTELVTHQLEGSDFEDESDFEDSEEDWRPAKGEQKPKKIKTAGRGRKSAGGSKNGGSAKRGRRQSRKVKKQSSDEEELSDEDVSEPEPTPPKKSRKSAKRSADMNASSDAYQSASEAPQPTETVVLKSEPTTSMYGNADVSPAPKPQPLQRKVATPVKSFPDKGGYLNLFIFKGDLKEGIVNSTQVCLWRRDGSSLLQKYLRDKTVQSELPQFNSSMVYSCWEDKRANEYLEVKVRCLEQSKQIRVELTDVEELEAKSKDEYDSYVATYGTPVPRSSAAQQDDDDDEDCDEDEMAAGEEDGGEEFEEDGENEEAAQEE